MCSTRHGLMLVFWTEKKCQARSGYGWPKSEVVVVCCSSVFVLEQLPKCFLRYAATLKMVTGLWRQGKVTRLFESGWRVFGLFWGYSVFYSQSLMPKILWCCCWLAHDRRWCKMARALWWMVWFECSANSQVKFESESSQVGLLLQSSFVWQKMAQILVPHAWTENAKTNWMPHFDFQGRFLFFFWYRVL